MFFWKNANVHKTFAYEFYLRVSRNILLSKRKNQKNLQQVKNRENITLSYFNIYREHFPNVYNDLRPRVKIAIRKVSRSFIPGNNPK